MGTTETANALRLISNSEATDWMTCKRMYYNAYINRLAPKTYRGPIAIGLLGHEAFERYYKGRVAGEHHEVARAYAEKTFNNHLRGENGSRADRFVMEDILKARAGFIRYMDYYGDESDEYEVISVEEKYTMPFIQTQDFGFAMRIDVLVKDKRTGELILRDFKFTYNFWSERKFKLRGQFPKYVLALRANGIHVDKVIVDQIRYREMKSDDNKDYLKRSESKVNDHKIRMVVRDHIQNSKEIMEFRSLSAKEQEKRATRLLIDPVCKYCLFAELCELELNGADTELFKKDTYEESTYGYNGENDLSIADIPLTGE